MYNSCHIITIVRHIKMCIKTAIIHILRHTENKDESIQLLLKFEKSY